MNESQPDVSVIVPIYNVQKYLRRCLESIQKQQLENIEIICVNDGSTDGSLEIVEEFVQQDTRFVVINKCNTGYGDSVNKGILQARGKYIGIVESDDFTEPDMYSKLFYAAEQSRADVVKGNYNFYFENSDTHFRFNELLCNCKYNETFEPETEDEIFHVPASVWSAIYRRDFLLKEGIFFLPTPGASYQDVSFTFKVFQSAKSVYCIKDAVINYRFDNMDSSVKNPKKVFCICDEFKEIESWINKLPKEKCSWLSNIMFYLKYECYKWNYYRIASMYQYAFLLRMNAEFNEAYSRINIDRKYWSEDEWEKMLMIKDTPDVFFEQTNLDYIDRFVLEKYVLNVSLLKEGFKEQLFKQFQSAEKVIIYGAGEYGKRALKAIKNHVEVFSFAVTQKTESTPTEFDGIPILQINELFKYRDVSLIIIAVKKASQLEIVEQLHNYGFEKVISYDEKFFNVI